MNIRTDNHPILPSPAKLLAPLEHDPQDLTLPSPSTLQSASTSPSNSTRPRRPLSEDPMVFVHDYCTQRNIPLEPGKTDIEKQCQFRADIAREEYKRLIRDDDHTVPPTSPSHEFLSTFKSIRRSRPREKLTGAQKYATRLRNNRKSAHAAKVYHEVFRREMSAVLAGIPQNDHAFNMVQSDAAMSRTREAAMHLELLRLRAELAQSNLERDQLRDRLATTECMRVVADDAANVAEPSFYWENGSGMSAKRDSG